MNIIIQSYIGADSYNICAYTMSVLLTLLFPVLLLASSHLVICSKAVASFNTWCGRDASVCW